MVPKSVIKVIAILLFAIGTWCIIVGLGTPIVRKASEESIHLQLLIEMATVVIMGIVLLLVAGMIWRRRKNPYTPKWYTHSNT